MLNFLDFFIRCKRIIKKNLVIGNNLIIYFIFLKVFGEEFVSEYVIIWVILVMMIFVNKMRNKLDRIFENVVIRVLRVKFIGNCYLFIFFVCLRS